MSEKPPKPTIISSDKRPLPGSNTESLIEQFLTWENSVDADLKASREETRNHVTKSILNAFIALILMFGIFLSCLAAFGDIERVPVLLESAKTLVGIVTPIVTFILGFYYATKATH